MSIFNFFRSPKKTSAEQAKERLQIVMAHARVGRTGPDFLPMLQQELLAVIAKYVDLDQNKVEVKLDKNEDCSTLEVNIELPVPGEGAAKVVPVKAVAKPAEPAKPAEKKPEPAKAEAKTEDKKPEALKAEAKVEEKKSEAPKAEAKDDSKTDAKVSAAGRG